MSVVSWLCDWVFAYFSTSWIIFSHLIISSLFHLADTILTWHQASDFDFGGPRPDVSGVGVSVPNANYGCTVKSGGIGGGAGDQGDYILVPGASKDGINDLEFIFWWVKW